MIVNWQLLGIRAVNFITRMFSIATLFLYDVTWIARCCMAWMKLGRGACPSAAAACNITSTCANVGRFHLEKNTYLILESQLTHRIVILLFTVTHGNIEPRNFSREQTVSLENQKAVNTSAANLVDMYIHEFA